MDFKYWEERQVKTCGRILQSAFTRTHYYKGGYLIATVEADGNIFIAYEKAFEGIELSAINVAFLDFFTIIKECIFDEEGYKAAIEKASDEVDVLNREFKAAVFKELNIDPFHPKVSKLWDIAKDWSRGEGLQSFFNRISVMSELLS